MTYEAFKRIVKTICARSGAGLRVRFSSGRDGMFIARYGDIVLTANKSAESITCNFGSGSGIKRSHMAMVKVGDLV